MRLRTTLTLVALSTAVLGGCASYSVYRVSRLRPDDRERLAFPAVFYALPRSVLSVEARVTKTTSFAAECAPFRDLARDLGLDEGALSSATRVEFRQSGVRLEERAEADPEQVFAVRVDDDALRNRTQSIDLSREGFLTKATVETTSKIEDYVVQTLEIAADITGRALKLFGAADDGAAQKDAVRKRCVAYKQEFQQNQDRRRDLITKAGPPIAADTLRLLLSQIEQRKAEILTHFTGTRTIQTGTIRCEHTPPSRYGADSAPAPGFSPVQRRALYRLSPAVGLSHLDPGCTVSESLSPEGGNYAAAFARAMSARLSLRLQRDRGGAELIRRCDEEMARSGAPEGVLGRATAEWAQELVEQLRVPIRSGQGDAVTAALASALQALEAPVLPAVLEALPPVALQGAPGAAAPRRDPALPRCDAQALLSLLRGIDRSELKLDLARAIEGAPVTLSIQVEEPEGQLASVVASWQRTPTQEAGFFYRVPGTALMSVGTDERRPILRTRRMVPQFGVVTALAGAGDVRSLAAHYGLELYPMLGTLQHFSAKTSALKLDSAAAAGRLATSAMDGVGARREADQARELDDLVRERMLLEERRKIRDLQLPAPAPNPTTPGATLAH